MQRICAACTAQFVQYFGIIAQLPGGPLTVSIVWTL